MFGFIRVGIFGSRFVNDRLGDDVALGGPVAEIKEAAALATKREVWVLGRVRGSFADWAAMDHFRTRLLQLGNRREILRLPAAKCAARTSAKTVATLRSE